MVELRAERDLRRHKKENCSRQGESMVIRESQLPASTGRHNNKNNNSFCSSSMSLMLDMFSRFVFFLSHTGTLQSRCCPHPVDEKTKAQRDQITHQPLGQEVGEGEARPRALGFPRATGNWFCPVPVLESASPSLSGQGEVPGSMSLTLNQGAIPGGPKQLQPLKSHASHWCLFVRRGFYHF